MKIINQSAKVLIPESPMKHIERIGRICYKSEDKIEDGTDRSFVSRMFKSAHHAMLEHYRFIMEVNPAIYNELSKIAPKHIEFTFSEGFKASGRYVISFNARALMELHENCRGCQFGYLKFAIKGIRDELITHIVKEYDCYELFGLDRNEPLLPLSTGVNFIENSPNAMSDDEWNTHGWMSVDMVTDRGITHEIVRHREETSYAQESTRYCNYGSDKFGMEIAVIDQGFSPNSARYNAWERSCITAEQDYNSLLLEGEKPQMARSVLPTCLKTEIVMTAPMYEWEHFFNLRMRGTTGAPHPLIKDLSTMAYNQMQEVFFNGNKN